MIGGLYFNSNALVKHAIFEDNKMAQSKLFNQLDTVLRSRTGKLYKDHFSNDDIEDIFAVTIARFFHMLKKKGLPFPNDKFSFPDEDALGKCINTIFNFVRLEFINKKKPPIVIVTMPEPEEINENGKEREKMYLILEQCMEKLDEPCRNLIIDRKYKEIKITNDFLKKHGFEENKKGYSQCTSSLNRCLGKVKKCAKAS